jgi:hypothetical protein
VAGYRSGWMVITGPKKHAAGSSRASSCSPRRGCAQCPAQHAVQAALSGVQSIDALIAPTGRLHEQRDAAFEGSPRFRGAVPQAARRALRVPRSILRSTRSTTMPSSSTTSSSPSTCCSCRAPASTGRRRITSGS